MTGECQEWVGEGTCHPEYLIGTALGGSAVWPQAQVGAEPAAYILCVPQVGLDRELRTLVRNVSRVQGVAPNASLVAKTIKRAAARHVRGMTQPFELAFLRRLIER